MALPSPTCTFTIPSIHGDTPLDCRIYHPACLSLHNNRSPLPRWRKRGAIIAHPYAPMGGSYDDPVVATVGRVLLGKGFVVGVFNFRGAGSSKGRTSWTSKAELADYTSFAGFFIHYLHYLEPHHLESPPGSSQGKCEGHLLEPIASALPLAVEPASFPFNDSGPHPIPPSDGEILLILGGYSYGSLITTHLPPTPSILSSFAASADNSSSNLPRTSQPEILLRAHHCATEWNKEAAALLSQSSSPKGETSYRRRSGAYYSLPHSPSGMVIGGEEGEPGARRKSSRECRRSFEIGRLSVEIPRMPSPAKKQRSRDLLRRQSSPSPTKSASLLPPPSPSPSSLQTAYLLISPLLPPISNLATLFTAPQPQPQNPNLTANPTLAVYGTHDIFTSYRKLSRWAQEMSDAAAGEGGGFKTVVVEGAGHFWVEDGVECALREGVAGWVDDGGLARGGSW